jgi:hypothetical protein
MSASGHSSPTTTPPGPTPSGPTPPGPVPVPVSTRRDAGTLVSAVLLRPYLWWTALGTLRRMAPRLWWRSSPHLPLPDRRLWEFRMVTAYGRPDAVPSRADVISFLEWCRAAAASSPPRPGGLG